MESKVVRVGIADLKAAKAPDLLVTLGLGSCVGITFYDARLKIGGLAHIMLPDSKQARAGSVNLAKFADTAIPLILEQLDKMGAPKSRLVVKIAGGAQMFAFMGADDRMRIGERNVEAVKLALKQQGLKISGEDTGANYGRSMELNLENGKVLIKAIEKGIKEL